MASLPAFATPAQLASTLGVEMPTGQTFDQWSVALDDASGYLRSVIGQPITAGTATLSLTTDERGEADIWLVPVTSITSVTDPEGNILTTDQWELVDQRLNVRRAHTVYTVVLAYGYTAIPSEIVRWTKVLANTQIQAAKQGSLGLNNVESVSVGDVHVQYPVNRRSTSPEMTVALPETEAQRLKATYGGTQ
jgi:hypothetical protein